MNSLISPLRERVPGGAGRVGICLALRRCQRLANSVGVARDDGEVGALFTTGDAGALAEAAGALLDDRDRRARLAAGGARRALDYDWSTVARDIVRVYETVAHTSVRAATLPRQTR